MTTKNQSPRRLIFNYRYKIGLKEFEFLKKLNVVDLDDKYYCL